MPQSELLSLISAAKSLGVRGLAEDNVLPREEEEEEARGVKREGEATPSRDPPALVKKPKVTGGCSQPPKLQQKTGQKLWTKRESTAREEEEDGPPPLKLQKENVQKEEEEQRSSDKSKKEVKPKVVKEKGGEKPEKTDSDSKSPKLFAPFFEVNVKQETEEDDEESNSDQTG